MSHVKNQCAGPFGGLYDFYIERAWLSSASGHVVWGVDLRPMCESMAAIGRSPDGATIVDFPAGGGVALRALRPKQDVRYIAGDIEPAMLERVRAKAAARGLTRVETVADAGLAALGSSVVFTLAVEISPTVSHDLPGRPGVGRLASATRR